MASKKNGNGSNPETAMPPIDGINAVGSLEDFADLAGQGFTIEEPLILQEGQMVRGVFQGPGSPIEMTDPNSGEVRHVATWKVRTPHAIFHVGAGAQLDNRMAGVDLEAQVAICRLQTGRTRKGHQLNQFKVAVKQ